LHQFKCVTDNLDEIEEKLEQQINAAVLSAEEIEDHFLMYLLAMALQHLAQSRATS
jgi:hypothetical protein